MQGPILYLLFAQGPLRKFALASDVNHWIVIFAAMAILVLVALAIHIFIERPGVSLGKRMRNAKREEFDPATPWSTDPPQK
jgi:peptidoglycan/LPS O-acetylase OafA/YrhL